MRNIFKIFMVLAVGLASAVGLRAEDVAVTSFGAVGDGVTMNTASIQAAIDFVAAKGGGKVIFTPGSYVSGSIFIKSGVRLELQEGAVILGSLNPWDYVKDPEAGWTALVFAIKQKNVGIVGKGTIDGRGYDVGVRFVDFVHMGLIDDKLSNDRVTESARPENLHFYMCDSIEIRDITIKNSACWTQQYDKCTNMLIDGIKVDSKNYWNNDGLDVVDCSNVVIRNSYIDSSDDAFCFKSHKDWGVSENILMENCTGRSSANGIKFGTATLGKFRHFRFKNIKIFDTYRSAIEIATVDGGTVEDVEVDGLQSLHTGNPIFIRVGSRHERADSTLPYLRNIVIKNVYAEVPFEKADAGYPYEGPVEDLPRNVCPSIIFGLPNVPVENIRLENVEIVYPGKADPEYAYRGISDAELDSIPELEKRYPEFSSWKELPAWGFYIRHASGVVFDNVRLKVADVDYRPAIVADDVNGLRLKDVKITDESADKRMRQIVAKDVRKLRKR
jgi:hypothetical protein